MIALWRHMRALWPRWTLLPPLPFFAYGAWLASQRALRWEHVALMIVVPALAYIGPRTKRLCVAAYPIALVGLLYDVMRYVKDVGVTASSVHVCDLRDAEVSLFGWGSGAGGRTLHDWFLTHHATALDLYCAVPYAFFLYAVLGVGVYLYRRDYSALQRLAWAFFLANIAAFVTYHLYPAAPPWYFHQHGCVVDVAAAPSAGPRLLHVDAVLGYPYFQSMYARASSVFGAVPSLHSAYPLIIAIEGWAVFGRTGRALAVLFALSMWFSAVYLDHHWVIDVLLGIAYGAAASAVIRVIARLVAPPVRSQVVPVTS